jgi:catechol 2,3-dioxygenase-like lactoylglutathione lyase family enzyme
MIAGLEHVGLSVRDLDRSVAFYRDVIGFTLLRIIECPPAMRLGDVVGMPGCSARIAHLGTGKAMLELFEYTDPRGRDIPADRAQADLGFIHVGITSTDTRADHARLLAAGVRFFNDPVEFRPGVWIAYFQGPDGEVCELRQAPEG